MQFQIFQSPDFGQIRTATDERDEPLFCAVDICRALGYGNSREAIRKHVDEDDVTKRDTIDSLGRKQCTSFVNESGLYALILSSKMHQAREFKRWVTSVVLPQIRKTGGYIPLNENEDEDENSLMARALLIAQKTIELKNRELEAQKPKVMFADAVTSCEDSILIRDMAKLLAQNVVVIGQNRLFSWLREKGYLFQHETRPIQKWVENLLRFNT